MPDTTAHALPPLAAPTDWPRWQARLPAALALLDDWLARSAEPRGLDWYRAELAALRAATGDRKPALDRLFRALGLAPRRVGKADLALDAASLARAAALRPGLDPSRWSADQAARVGLILGFAGSPVVPTLVGFAALLDELATQSGLQEQVALHLGYAFYPPSPLLAARAGEALRTGIRPVFAAMALRNPWPAEVFSQPAWNHLVVKTFSLELPLWPVQGLAERANAELSTMLVRQAEERWSADRPVSPELWRLVALCPGEHGVAALSRLRARGDAEALATLALACRDGDAATLAPLAAGLPAPVRDWVDLAPWRE